MADPIIQLQLHIAPSEPIEIHELTFALSALSRQYDKFVSTNEEYGGYTKAKLLVSSVAPGSIDISFIPDFGQLAGVVTAVAPIVDQVGHIVAFGKQIKSLLDYFKKAPSPENKRLPVEYSVADCEDAVNILNPVAEHGGSQSFNIFNGPVIVQNLITVKSGEAKESAEHARQAKAILQFPQGERHQRVPLVWKRLDRASASTGKSSPDKGVIEEIDLKPKSILFSDEMAYLKKVMVTEDDSPFLKIHFVDVEVSRVGGKIVSYRVTGYHGSEELDSD